ncbi:BED-type domain-containing protein [Caenorhabditis elegans]|uniref:BED-type domain-containing protein n=1 Tax=Caenorhabditis elegans TaxID=6239 RepID=Q20131_CAEEL|nr:BED-type domain-containing protein [Caenorhabditis elegans]CAA99849.1 BED-type domain-containing protein [Caenorhabditis elegans]|eukprot:NP_492744.1 Uncharacterized protein CELE_F37D6.3 [Caenorhabditis elegans]
MSDEMPYEISVKIYALIPREFLWTDGSSVQCGLCRQNNASVTLPHAPGAIRHFKRRHRKTYNSFSKEVRYQDYRAQGEAGQDPNFEYNRYPVQNQHMMAQGPGVYPMLAAAAPQEQNHLLGDRIYAGVSQNCMGYPQNPQEGPRGPPQPWNIDISSFVVFIVILFFSSI